MNPNARAVGFLVSAIVLTSNSVLVLRRYSATASGMAISSDSIKNLPCFDTEETRNLFVKCYFFVMKRNSSQ